VLRRSGNTSIQSIKIDDMLPRGNHADIRAVSGECYEPRIFDRS
jgi:hypothetical protein